MSENPLWQQTGNQGDQMLDHKVAQMFQKADPKVVTAVVYIKSGVFPNSPKSHQIFGLLLEKD